MEKTERLENTAYEDSDSLAEAKNIVGNARREAREPYKCKTISKFNRKAVAAFFLELEREGHIFEYAPGADTIRFFYRDMGSLAPLYANTELQEVVAVEFVNLGDEEVGKELARYDEEGYAWALVEETDSTLVAYLWDDNLVESTEKE